MNSYPGKTHYVFILILLQMIGLIGCAADPVVVLQTSTPIHTNPVQPTAQTVSQRTFQPISTSTPTPSGPCEFDANLTDVRHMVVADIDYPNRAVSVFQGIRYINRTGAELNNILLHVEPNYWPPSFQLNRVEIASEEAEYDLNGRRLLVTLPEALEPGCALNLNLAYQLRIPVIGDGVHSSKGFYGQTWRQMNLGHWLATVAPYQDDWISRDATIIGEYEVLNVADWSVTLNLVGDTTGLTIAAPGALTQTGENTYRYELNSARDFTVSLSDRFNIASAETVHGTTVEVYTFADTPDNGAPAQALDTAVRSMEVFHDYFGDYHYDKIIVVQGDFPDGMEFSGIVFVGDSWFTRFPGGVQNYLTLITAHEVAHQWWYASVGNDSALAPWLDEALATYSEYIFIEQHYPDLRDWWWSFRVDSFSPLGFVDSNIYEFSSTREYINAVYLRGVRMLHALRENIGPTDFFQLLNAYATAGRGQLVKPDTFWNLLTAEQLTLTEQTRNTFLKQPNVIVENN